MDLKTALIVGGVALLLFVLSKVPDFIAARVDSTKTADIRKSNYRYYSRKYLMTEQENQFYHRLYSLVGRYWYIAPQINLSALLNHKVKGQNWSAAFRHINGKSVDYVLISKKSGEIICAIELEDATHNRESRIVRDEEINRLFSEANIPLARFRNAEKLKDREILDTIRATLRGDSEEITIRKVWDK